MDTGFKIVRTRVDPVITKERKRNEKYDSLINFDYKKFLEQVKLTKVAKKTPRRV